MIKHIVTFKLKGTAEERREVASKFAEALNRLPQTVECLRSIEAAVNENPDEDWDIVLTAVVDNWDDLSKYANHPEHLAAAALIKDHKEARACVDYIIE